LLALLAKLALGAAALLARSLIFTELFVVAFFSHCETLLTSGPLQSITLMGTHGPRFALTVKHGVAANRSEGRTSDATNGLAHKKKAADPAIDGLISFGGS
jgi:hypothetical protein